MNEQTTYIMAMAIGGLIEAMGMFAENQQRLQQQKSPAYDQAAFLELIDKYGLNHNAIISNLYPERVR